MKRILIILIIGGITIWLTYSFLNKEGLVVPNQEGLPKEVEAKRQAIAEAAQNKDYQKLASLIDPNQFNYTFGEAHSEGFIGFLREKNNTQIILNILTLPYIERFGIYSWPSVFLKNSSDWTPNDIEIMKTVYTEKEVEQFRLYGSYTGWRIGIRQDGAWIYFIAGD